ncbi:RluA family pseudouridine synthase [Fodinisporobacter ferrooxydans]|uniref:Pseudouridine synthase n=2 Tax=Fodinisporobacter ferrooxydans TaxID=2901836 RepID=A0ABY4CRC4_9BACL|nr:RluA family pseudouridine synthase [Alicyclobacillaceae bacterium MYW30-H2]
MSRKTPGRTKPSQTTEPKESRFIVKEPGELMQWLLATLAGKGRNKVKGILARGQVSVEGNVVTQYDYPLAAGNRVVIDWSEKIPEAPIEGLEILYEDADLIVIDKEAGLLSIATEGEKQQTAYRMLMEHVRKKNPQNRVFVVHRLDRETSGVMMYAKREQIQEHLQSTWRNTVVERTYVAVVEGCVAKSEGTIRSWLKESKTLQMYSSRTDNGGLEAITHYKVLQADREYSLLEVKLETGRKNQIRVHMQEIGHSIVGDKRYGAKKNPIGRLGLHARVLTFRHPATGQLLSFETEIPKKFLRLFQTKNK